MVPENNILLLLIIQLLIQIKGGVVIQESLTLYLMGAYFLFGLATVFFSRNTTIGENRYADGFRLYGAVISGFMILLFWGIFCFTSVWRSFF